MTTKTWNEKRERGREREDTTDATINIRVGNCRRAVMNRTALLRDRRFKCHFTWRDATQERTCDTAQVPSLGVSQELLVNSRFVVKRTDSPGFGEPPGKFDQVRLSEQSSPKRVTPTSNILRRKQINYTIVSFILWRIITNVYVMSKEAYKL